MNKIIGRLFLTSIGVGLIIGLAGCNSAPVQEGTPPARGEGGGSPVGGSPAGRNPAVGSPGGGSPGSGSPSGGSPR